MNNQQNVEPRLPDFSKLKILSSWIVDPSLGPQSTSYGIAASRYVTRRTLLWGWLGPLLLGGVAWIDPASSHPLWIAFNCGCAYLLVAMVASAVYTYRTGGEGEFDILEICSRFKASYAFDGRVAREVAGFNRRVSRLMRIVAQTRGFCLSGAVVEDLQARYDALLLERESLLEQLRVWANLAYLPRGWKGDISRMLKTK